MIKVPLYNTPNLQVAARISEANENIALKPWTPNQIMQRPYTAHRSVAFQGKVVNCYPVNCINPICNCPAILNPIQEVDIV